MKFRNLTDAFVRFRMNRVIFFICGLWLSVAVNGSTFDFSERHRATIKLEGTARQENIKKVTEQAKHRVLQSAASENAEVDGISLEGDWQFRLYDVFYDRTVNYTFYGMLVGNTLLIENLGQEIYPIIGDFDPSTNKFTITKRLVGTDWRGRYVFIEPKPTGANGRIEDGPVEATYNPETGELKFNSRDYIAFIDYSNMEGTEDVYDTGEWFMVYSSKRSGDLDKDNPANWTALGEATVVDGWLSPRFGIDQTRREHWLHPQLLQYHKNKNIYRLLNPFADADFSQHNSCTTNGYIEFDISDTNHVVLNRIDAGFICPDISITKLYCYNVLSYYLWEYRSMGKSYDDLNEFLRDVNSDIPFSTYKDGVVDFSAMLYAGELVYDANFGEVNYPTGGNTWKNANMRTRIYFPNVEVTEPEINFTADSPMVNVNFDDNAADIYIDFEYKNLPQNATIFAIVTDNRTGKWVARKYINLAKYENTYSFTLDNLDKDVDYDYSLVVRIEGALSEVLTNSLPVKLNFSTDPRSFITSGINAIEADSEPAVYFNLQGLKVENPRKGELYIKRRGNKVEKVIY